MALTVTDMIATWRREIGPNPCELLGIIAMPTDLPISPRPTIRDLSFWVVVLLPMMALTLALLLNFALGHGFSHFLRIVGRPVG